MPKIEDLLALAADLEHFAPQNDALGQLIDRVAGDELELEDMDRIAAAAGRPSYAGFLESLEKRRKKRSE